MKKPQIYTILANLNVCMDLLGAQIRKDEGSLGKNLSDASTHLGKAYACFEGQLSESTTNPDTDVKKTDTDEMSEESQRLSDNQLEKAYGLLKDQSKPGPKILQDKMKIKQATARSLYKQLVDSGRITKPTRAKAKPKTQDAEPNVSELLDKLPAGNDLLVSAHLHPLMNLDSSAHRGLYLSGLNAKDYFDATDIARVTANGVDRTLVNQMVELQKTKPPKIKEADIVKAASAEKGGDERAQKYHKLRVSCINAINKGTDSRVGADLYRHMARNGLTTQVLADLKLIATAYSKGRA